MPETQQALGNLDELVDSALIWAANMQGYATATTFGGRVISQFGLWNVEPYVEHFNPVIDANRPGETIVLRPPDLAVAARAYDQIVVGVDAASAAPSQSDLNERLNNQVANGANRGLGSLVAAVYRGALVRHAQTA